MRRGRAWVGGSSHGRWRGLSLHGAPLYCARRTVPGGMAEWLKALAWKACIRETVSWVRIPLPPPAKYPSTSIHVHNRRAVRPTGRSLPRAIRLYVSAEVCHNPRRERGILRGFRRTTSGGHAQAFDGVTGEEREAGRQAVGRRWTPARRGPEWQRLVVLPLHVAGDRPRALHGARPAGRRGLAKAREAAQEARGLLRRGLDPIDHRNAARAAAKAEASRAVTFKAYAEGFISSREATWKIRSTGSNGATRCAITSIRILDRCRSPTWTRPQCLRCCDHCGRRRRSKPVRGCAAVSRQY